jgi:acetate kinase
MARYTLHIHGGSRFTTAGYRVNDRTHDWPAILTINAGSSSIRFALFEAGARLQRRLEGKVDRIGSHRATLAFSSRINNREEQGSVDIPVGTSATGFLIDWLESRAAFQSTRVVGHRVVHGMHHSAPTGVTPALLQELRRIQPFDPEHLPLEIELIEEVARRHPQLPQVACFDTAFHRDMPRVAKQIAVPRRFEQLGLQRYGFHGLSYTYLMEELARQQDPAASTGRIILAHLGNGASMVAARDGGSIDTSMGLTPASGLVMGTRSGDIDPGLFRFLARAEMMTAGQMDHMLNHESGLLGVSELSADARELLERESSDVRAAEALALFCYQAKKCIGAHAAALGGLDTLVFTGGIGENAPPIRGRICTGLEFLGIHLDPQRNIGNASVISPDGAPVTLRVIRTDEELVIARSCAALVAIR